MSTGGGAGAFGRPPPSHHPPTRDASTLKYVLYGPGHEKYPSWPMPAATEVPVAIRVPPTGGSQRSKSWTDHTNYPKEHIISYTRPYMKRSNSSQPQQLKTVLERCEKKNIDSIQYLHNMDHRKSTNTIDFNSPSPPERDQQKCDISKMVYKTYSKESIMPLTQADLEEYTKKFDETTLIQHQKQSSYAQSEGYHSYVSSSDSSSTPFIDSLKRDIDASAMSMSHISSWDGESTVTTRSGSVSSSETLKWHGSLSDMSDVSNSSGTSPRQLIVHSARVQTPQKQNSESVLYMPRNSLLSDRPSSQRASFMNTLPSQRTNYLNAPVYPSPVAPRKTVAECINIYEGKNIKAIQKKALLSFYERHQEQNKKDLRHSVSASHSQGLMNHMNLLRQHSMESSGMKRTPQQLETHNSKCQIPTIDSPNSIFQGPVIMGPSISVDEWVPERPPKSRQLLMPLSPDTSLKPQRLVRPNIPMLSPQMHPADSDILFKYDDPFIAMPEHEKELRQLSQRMSFDNYTQSGEPQANLSNDKIHAMKPPEIPIQSLKRPLENSTRKCINPFIKSTSMKYDSHKIDQSHIKYSTACNLIQNVQPRSDTIIKRVHDNKNFIDKAGQYRAEPMDPKRELIERESKICHNSMETSKFVQSKHEQIKYNSESFNKPYEMTGQYRAEPLNLHPDRHAPYVQPDSSRNIQTNKLNSIPPPVGPKIFRSKSESNHMSNMRNVAHHINNTNNFSKPITPHQNVQRIFQNSEPVNVLKSQTSFGNKDNLSSKDVRLNKSFTDDPTSDFTKLTVNNLSKKEIEKSIVKDDRPPLPEKKKNSLMKNEETKITITANVTSTIKSVDLPIESDVASTVPLLESSHIANSKHGIDSTEPILNDSSTVVPEICKENNEASVELLQNDSNVSDRHEILQTNVYHVHDKVIKLQTRTHLPEEVHWNKLWPTLLHSLPDGHGMRIVISELEEYNNTALDIVNMFAADVDALISEESSQDVKNPHSIENNESHCTISELDDNTNLNELPLKHPINVLTDKKTIEDCLDLLEKALQKQEETLDKMAKNNDETGVTIVNTLQEPHATRLSRLMNEMGLITSLISGLISRYNRMKKSLSDVPSPNQNKNTLEMEMGRLTEKLEDAKALKKHIDNRKTKLLPILRSELKDVIRSFNYFMSTKIRLIIHIRDIKDRIDIIKRLRSALNQEKSCIV